MIYTEKLYFSVPLENSQLNEVKVDEAMVEQLGDITHYSTQLNGKTFEVYERKSVIFPQVSGEMVIPGPIYTGEIGSRFFGGGRPIRVSHPPIRLQVLPKPASYPSNAQWIPAQELSLDYNWRGNPQQLNVGEPITLDLTLRGQGLSSAQLPNLDLDGVKGLKYYPDQAQTTENKDERGITGIRKQSIAIVATKGGSITLPEIRIPWWNIERQQLEYAVLPAQRLSANGASQNQSEQATASQEESANETTSAAPQGHQTEIKEGINVWMIVSAILLLLWLATLTLWLKAPKKHILEETKNQNNTMSANAKRRNLKKACRNNDPEATRAAVIDWASNLWGQSFSSLSQVIQACEDKTLSSALSELDYTLYSATGNSAWQGEYLWQLLNAYKPGLDQKNDPLTPLYPA